MSPAQWVRLKELFEAASERPQEDREQWLERVCGGEEELAHELRRLLAHAGEMGTFLEASEPGHSHTFSRGDCIAGRFEILDFLGQGGMGEVYSAHDRVLGTSVAIKTIRADISSTGKNVERLHREIQLARQVTHRNVCRLFDLEQHAGPDGTILFLTMELIPGETLAQRIARSGPLSQADTARIAGQIALALDAAHRARIVHRDLKPANVMLSPGTESDEPLRAVVMDFGLARRSDPLAAETRELFGTPAYMAPELLEGADASVATDIFAFGRTIAEMLTGRKSASNGLAHQADFAAVEARWRAAIERCLDPLPDRRPVNALEVMALATGESPAPRRPVFSRRWAVMAAASLATVALSVAAFRTYEQRPSFPEGGTLLLSDIVNATGDRNLDATTEVFRTQLAQSMQLRLWDRARLLPLLQTMNLPLTESLRGKVAREVAFREGVPFVLFGNIAPLGEGISLNLRLEQLSSTSIFTRGAWEFSVQVSGREHLWDGIHQSSVWLRRCIGENSEQLAGHDRLPQETTTGSWEALALYAQAEQAKLRNAPDEAVSLLKQSLVRDPHFALAYMRLGDILLAMHQQGEGLRYWETALTEAKSRHLTRREQLRISGLFASEVQDYSAAEAYFSQMEREYPRDYLPSFYAGDALCWQGRFADAAGKMEAAQRKNPDSVPAASNLAIILLLSGRFADMNPVLEKLTSLGAPDLAAYSKGLLAFARGDYPAALANFHVTAASGNPDRRSRGFAALGALLAELGRYREAREAIAAGIQADQLAARLGSRADKLLMLAYLDLRTGDRTSLRNLCLQASAVEDSPNRITRSAVLLARAGYAAESGKLMRGLARFPASPLRTVSVERIRAELALANREIGAALKSCATVDTLEPRIRLKDYLGRAYLASRQYDKAIQVFNRIADTPALLWQTIDFDYPGILTDCLLDMAAAADRAHDPIASRRAIDLYTRRRETADPGVLSAVDTQRHTSHSSTNLKENLK